MHLRLHKSSIVVGLGTALLLVLVAIPGRVDEWSPGAFAKYEHGWPFVYLRRETVHSPFATTAIPSRRDAQSQLPMWGIPWCRLANWKFWQAHYEDGVPYWDFSGRTLAADCLLSLLLLVAIVGSCEFRRRRRKNPFGFSLVDMFVVITVACAALSWVAHLKHGSERETAIMARFDDWRTPLVEDVACAAPVWIRALTGEKWMPGFTWRARSVLVEAFNVEDAKQLCDEIRELSYLNKLILSGFLRGDHFPFATLGSIRQLEILQIDTAPQFDDRDVRELSQLSGLKKIAIAHGIAPERLSRLESALPGCKVVDANKDW